MEIKININDYNARDGLNLTWKDGYKIMANQNQGEIVIFANENGLISLANHFLTLAQPSVPAGTHVHLDEYNSLEEGSAEIIIQKVD